MQSAKVSSAFTDGDGNERIEKRAGFQNVQIDKLAVLFALDVYPLANGLGG